MFSDVSVWGIRNIVYFQTALSKFTINFLDLYKKKKKKKACWSIVEQFCSENEIKTEKTKKHTPKTICLHRLVLAVESLYWCAR